MLFSRISRQQMFMGIAMDVAKRSTCFRASVGAVLVLDNNVISHGYNGPPSKQPHCTGNKCKLSLEGSCTKSIHAEINAIKRSRLKPDRPNNKLHLYCTHEPCLGCAISLAAIGVSKVIYTIPYKTSKGSEFLINNGIKVMRITLSGFLVDIKTNELVSHETF